MIPHMSESAENTERHVKPKSVRVIVNPALSRRIPLLAILNQAFRDAGIHWDISITHGTGDGSTLARRAVEEGAGAVAVYGGDGTVMEVAAGLLDSGVPMLILGGGTGNLVASELRLPTQLDKACELICGEEFETRRIDAGMIGERPFLLRIGCGIEVGVVQETSREMKNRFGKLAYVMAALKQLQGTPEADYELVLDDKEIVSASGVACVVANAGTVGVGKLTLAPSVDVCDGKLDVFFLKRAGIEGIAQVVSKMTGLDRFLQDEFPSIDFSPMVSQWSVETVEIRTDPILDIQVDGDVIAKTPQVVRVLPAALRVVV